MHFILEADFNCSDWDGFGLVLKTATSFTRRGLRDFVWLYVCVYVFPFSFGYSFAECLDLIMAAAETEDKDESEERFKESSNSSEKMNSLPEIDERPELIKGKSYLMFFLCVCAFVCLFFKLGLGFHKTNSFWFCSSTNRLWVLETLTGSLYLEPPDVRRQLNHYTMMAQSSIKSKVNVQLSKLPENSVLHCEFCNFSTGHLSSIRRHCLNRHGKKILRCKDCNFFTGLR